MIDFKGRLLSLSVTLATGAAALAIAGCSPAPAPPPPAQVLAAVSDAYGLAVDETTAYVSGLTTAPVVAVPLNGGAFSSLSARAQGGAIAVDHQNLYWSDGTFVFACQKSNCRDNTIALASQGAQHIVVADSTVYWSVNNLSDVLNVGHIMKSVQSQGMPGPPVEVATTAWIRGFAVDEQNVYWINETGAASDIMRAALDGGSPTTLASADPTPLNSITLDATNVYFTTNDGRLLYVPKSGGPGHVLLGDLNNDPNAVATDGTRLYVTGVNRLLSMRVQGGPQADLADNIGEAITAIALDDASVYLVDELEGVVMKVSK